MHKNMLKIMIIGIGCVLAGARIGYAEDPVSFSLSGKDATQLVTQALAASGLKSDDVLVHIQGINDADTLASADTPLTGAIQNMQVDKAHARWEATLQPQADGRDMAAVHLTGHYDEMRTVPTLVRTMSPGEIVTKDDIELSKQPAAHVHNNTITEAESLIGKSARRMLPAHRPIRQDEIAGAIVINKGARVAMVFNAGNLSIRTIGEALDNGAPGEVVRVRNIESKTIVQGIVEATGRVRVGSPDTNTAELQ